jgi:hypothetical protein
MVCFGFRFDVNLTINNTDLRARKMQGKQYRLGDQIITGYDDYLYTEKRQSESVSNDTYAQECGACHFAYQPWLLR